MTAPPTGRPAVPGRPEILFDQVVRVLAPNPSPLTGPGTNTYLVGEGDLAVIDPGPDDPVHLAALRAAIGPARVRRVLVTHWHADHAPLAARLAAEFSAEVGGSAPAPTYRPDVGLCDGDVAMAGPDWRLEAVATPGHSADHLCFVLLRPERPSLVFTGDHVMEGSTVVIPPPEGDMDAYLESLARLLALRPEPAALLPGHGGVLSSPRAYLEEYVAHRLAREEAIARAVATRGPATVAEVAAVVYPEVGPELRSFAELSTWAHLRRLRRLGRVVSEGAVSEGAVSEDDDERRATWRAVADEGNAPA